MLNPNHRCIYLLVIALLLAIGGRFAWLVAEGRLSFQSDILALIPEIYADKFFRTAYNRVLHANKNTIVIMIDGDDTAVVDDATDHFVDQLREQPTIAEVIDSPDLDNLSARVQSLLPYRDQLIADQTWKILRDDAEKQIQNRLEKTSAFPLASLTPLDADPIGVLDDFIQERLTNAGGLASDGLYLHPQNDNSSNVVLAQVADDELAGTGTLQAVEHLIKHKKDTESSFSVNTSITGIPIYAAHIRGVVSNEIIWMSICTTLLMIFIFAYVIRSWVAIICTAMLLTMAIASGLSVAELITGLPDIISMTIAVTVIGICIDFSIHYWAHRSAKSKCEVVSEIAPGISMSLITTLGSYLVIAVTSIPVLRQSAILLCAALVISWAMVMWVLPLVTPAKKNHLRFPNIKWHPPLALVLTVLLGLGGISLLFLTNFDDRPIKLKMAIPQLDNMDAYIREKLGKPSDSPIMIVRSSGVQETLEYEEAITTTVDPKLRTEVSALSRLVPSIKEQQKNKLHMAGLAKEKNVFSQDHLHKRLGYAVESPSLPLKGWYVPEVAFASSWGHPEKSLWLGCENGKCGSIMRATTVAQDALQSACIQNDRCQSLSVSQSQKNALANLRTNLFISIFIVLGVTSVILFVRYQCLAWKLLLVPVTSVIAGLTSVGWFGYPLTLFTVAAAFPLIGLSVDYAIFMAESKTDRSITRSAVVISALTTALTFWILSLSTTPAIKYFAIPIAVGIPVAWIVVNSINPQRKSS